MRGPEGRPEGVGLASARGSGKGPPLSSAVHRTMYSADGGRSGLLDDPLYVRGRGPTPRGPATAVSRTAVVRAERAEARGATPRRPAGDAERSVSSAGEG